MYYESEHDHDDLISIVIPTFNRADLIPETLNSIVRQDHFNWETIVVDDGSVDHTSEVLEWYSSNDSRIKWCKRPKNVNKGVCICRNFGLKKSLGEYITFFDSDDLMHPKYLSTLYTVLKKNPDLDIVSCKARKFVVEKGKKKYSEADWFTDVQFPNDFISRKVNLGTPEFMFRRSVLDSKHLWDENLCKAEDYELYSRILLDYNCLFVNAALVYNRVHNNRLTAQYMRASKRLILSDFHSRARVYKCVKNKGLTDQEINKFIIARQLHNFYLAIKSGCITLAIKIIWFIIRFDRKFSKRKQIIGFLRLRLHV